MEKLKYFEFDIESAKEKGFFETYKGFISSALRFSKDNPCYEKIGRYFFSESEDIKRAIMGENSSKGTELYGYLLKCGMEKGEIRKDIDIELWSFLILNLQYSIGDYYMKLNSDLEGVADKINEMLDVLKNGLSDIESEVKK